LKRKIKEVEDKLAEIAKEEAKTPDAEGLKQERKKLMDRKQLLRHS